MIHHYDHRWATYDKAEVRDLTPAEHADPSAVALPRYWVSKPDVDDRLEDRWDKSWLLGFRNVCRATDDRSLVAGVFGRSAVGHSTPQLAELSAFLKRIRSLDTLGAR